MNIKSYFNWSSFLFLKFPNGITVFYPWGVYSYARGYVLSKEKEREIKSFFDKYEFIPALSGLFVILLFLIIGALSFVILLPLFACYWWRIRTLLKGIEKRNLSFISGTMLGDIALYDNAVLFNSYRAFLFSLLLIIFGVLMIIDSILNIYRTQDHISPYWGVSVGILSISIALIVLKYYSDKRKKVLKNHYL